MNKVIKIDMKNNYFINKDTGQMEDMYKQSDNLMLVAKLEDGSVLQLENKNISRMYGGQLGFKLDNDENGYIVEDGHQNLMIRSGYIVLNNYDKEMIEDKDKGYRLRTLLMEYIKDRIINVKESFGITEPVIYNDNLTLMLTFEMSGYRYIVSVQTINSIVNKNIQRKLNRLPYYPFIKGFDKYGTMYLTIFCQKLEGEPDPQVNKYNITETFIIRLIDKLNKFANPGESYRFERIINKKRIIYYEGI